MLKTVAITMALLVCPITVMAHGHLWYEKNSHMPKYKKIIVYPMGWIKTDNLLFDSDEKSVIYKMNDYLDKKLVRRLKYKTISLGRILAENKTVRQDEEKYKVLYGPFSGESERAQKIMEVDAGANGYLVPCFTDNRDEPHLSPETVVEVPMKSYTEEENGPNGHRIYNERHWTERFVIPAQELNMHHMGIECIMYNSKGEKVLTFENSAHEYNNENYKKKELSMYKDLVDEFYNDVNDMVKKPEEDEEKRTGPRLGFGHIDLPENVAQNETLLRSVYFTTKSRAYRIKKARIVYDDDGNRPVDYYVTGKIRYYDLDRTWIPPWADTYDALVSSKDTKWRDRNGEEHTMHTREYRSKITGHHGRWKYQANVRGSFQLIDAKTGQTVVSYESSEHDDKTGDAYIHFIDKFYKKVKNTIYK